jgi:PHP family Zn ribbon phosphoesterase
MAKAFSYDLHMHSCLSPCGDIDMTPNNLVNMSMLQGLDLIALTDHNTACNCPAALEVARELPITVLPGLELNTCEEIHVVFVFPELDNAMAFDSFVYKHLDKVENRHEIFGEQIIMDSSDRPIGVEDMLLINATDISIDDTWKLAKEFGGFCWPAHIDRPSNSLIAALGFLPPDLPHPTLEVKNPEQFFADGQYAELYDKFHIITNSDAHTLIDIPDPLRSLTLESCDYHGLVGLLGNHK